jgi:hypothetical protein
VQQSPGAPIARPIQAHGPKQAGDRAYAPFDTQLQMSRCGC